MKTILKPIFIILILFLIGCNPNLECDEIVEQITPTSEMELSTDEFIKGFLIDIKNDRFSFKCIIKENESIDNQFKIDSTNTKGCGFNLMYKAYC